SYYCLSYDNRLTAYIF
nr:immunoglobulin light chain junction region [Macaca mulatta]